MRRDYSTQKKILKWEYAARAGEDVQVELRRLAEGPAKVSTLEGFQAHLRVQVETMPRRLQVGMRRVFKEKA